MHFLARYNARTGKEHSDDENAMNSTTNPESTAALCLPPPSPPPAATPRTSEATAALRLSSPAAAAAAAAAETALSLAEAASVEREQGELARWKEQRRLSVERSVRAIAVMLLKAGGNVDSADSEGNTPLLTAASTGGVVLCELLLARGANADARWGFICAILVQIIVAINRNPECSN